jgi:hypothetical protein
VRAVVVHDQVDVLVARHRCINGFEELQEFHAAVTALELSDDFASGHIQRCEQRRCAMTLVVVRARAGFAKRQWQPWLGAIQGLDLALLVHAQHQGAIRWCHIQPHHIAHLVHEMRISGQLEGLLQMRLQAKRMPDALHRRR